MKVPTESQPSQETPAQHHSAQAPRPFSGGAHAHLPYRYCSWAADSTTTVFVVPAFWPPKPEESPGAGDAEAEGAAPEGPGACGADAQGPEATGSEVWASGVADVDAGEEAEGEADAGADVDAEGEADAERVAKAGTYRPPASSTAGKAEPRPIPEAPSRPWLAGQQDRCRRSQRVAHP